MGRDSRAAVRRQHRGAEAEAVEHQSRRDNLRRSGAQGRPRDAQPGARQGKGQSQQRKGPGGEDKEGVEHHIQGAHEDIEHTGGAHVPAALEHAARRLPEQDRRQGAGVDKEVAGGVRADIRCAPQPDGQTAADADAHTGEHHTEQQGHHQPLAQDALDLVPPSAADELGNLDGKAGDQRHAHTAEKPCGAGNQADGGGGPGAQRAHHGRVDVLHGNGADLRQYGRHAQAHHQPHLLPERGGCIGTQPLAPVDLF